jgi:MFS family permease
MFFIVSIFVLPFASNLEVLVIATTGMSIGYNLMLPTINALASKSVSASWQGRVLGLMASSTSLGRITGPTLGGWLLGRDAANGYEHYGRTPFWTSSVIMFVALSLAMTVRSEPRPAKEELIKEDALGAP